MMAYSVSNSNRFLTSINRTLSQLHSQPRHHQATTRSKEQHSQHNLLQAITRAITANLNRQRLLLHQPQQQRPARLHSRQLQAIIRNTTKIITRSRLRNSSSNNISSSRLKSRLRRRRIASQHRAPHPITARMPRRLSQLQKLLPLLLQVPRLRNKSMMTIIEATIRSTTSSTLRQPKQRLRHSSQLKLQHSHLTTRLMPKRLSQQHHLSTVATIVSNNSLLPRPQVPTTASIISSSSQPQDSRRCPRCLCKPKLGERLVQACLLM